MMKNFSYFIFCFLLSGLITLFFVSLSPVYISNKQMLLSTFIAGGKWAIQIAAALLFLKEKSFLFLRRIGFVCFMGSCVLIPFIILINDINIYYKEFFISSLLLAIAVMIPLYYRAVKQTELHIKWWFGWLCCLAIAILLQLTVVFHYLKLF